MKKKENKLSQTLILAFILLAGTGLFLWKAGFFEQKEPIQIIQREITREYKKCFQFRCYSIDGEEICFSQ